LFSTHTQQAVKQAGKFSKFQNYLPRVESSEKIISRGLSHRQNQTFSQWLSHWQKLFAAGLSHWQKNIYRMLSVCLKIYKKNLDFFLNGI
jgi:hypothetical protein